MGLVEPTKEALKGLPLPIRMALRDAYFKNDSATAKAASDLSGDLGLTVDVHVDWPALWGELQPDFPDPTLFVSSVATAATAALTSIRDCCTDDEVWGDKLLEHVQKQRGPSRKVLNMHVMSVPGPNDIAPHWQPVDDYWWLQLPRGRANAIRTLQASSLRVLTHGVFDERPSQVPDRPVASAQTSAPPSQSAPTATAAIPANRNVPLRMPNLEQMPRPMDLSNSAVPYLCTVRDTGDAFTVTCTHVATLETLVAYLERFSEPNPNLTDTRTYGEIKREPSYFGRFNASFEVARRTTFGVPPTPSVVFSLLQGCLGYSLLFTNGNTWVFQRHVPFE